MSGWEGETDGGRRRESGMMPGLRPFDLSTRLTGWLADVHFVW